MDYNKQYYNEDRRVGDQCFFDGTDTYIHFNADLKSFLFHPGQITVDTGRSVGLENIARYRGEADPAELTLEFYVGGPSYEATQTNISNLFLAAEQCIIRREGDIFEYAAVLTDREVEDTEVEPYHLVTCTFAAVRRKPLSTIYTEKDIVIFNEGNTKSGARISFTATKACESFQVMGITLNGIQKGKTYVIDGMKGRVTADGINYFANTDLIDFPKILPGKNEIHLSESMPVMVSFYPVFL